MPSVFPQETAAPLFVNHTPDLVFGLFIGVMMTAAMYLFFIWAVIRDRSQIFLMLLLLCLGINMASTNDSMLQLMGIYSANMVSLLQNYSLILSFFFSLLFTYAFLEVDTNTPFMKTPLIVFALTQILVLAIASLSSDVRFILPTLGSLSVSLALAIGLITLQMGVNGALSHLTAFTAFLVGSMAMPLYDLGLIDSLDTAKNFMYMGYAIAAMMFAIVIAGQFATRQEEKEKALEVSNERFSLAARGSNEGLFDWDRNLNTFYISEQFRRITNLPRPLSPKSFKEWLSLVYAPDRLLIMKALRKLKYAAGTSTVSFEYRVRYSNAEMHWIHTKMVAVKPTNSTHIQRLVGSIGDVTQRKRSESALRASEVRFRSITEAHPVPVLIIKLQDNAILYASPGAENLLGLPHATLISHTLDRFLVRALERKEIHEAITSGQEVNMKEVMLSRGDGDPLPAALSARRINYQNEAAMVIGLYDLTERKKAEVKIAMQQEALQQSEKMAALGGLLAGVAHELNNPLSVVMGQTTLLMENQKEEKTKTRAEKIFKAADRCSRIVKSFLSLARRKAPEHKNVALNDIIHASLELLTYQFRNENVTLKLELEDNLPSIVGDDDQLTQVFTNLALNAAQAMRNFEGARNLTIRSALREGGPIVLSFIDTGPGVPAELQKRIFEPFFTTKGSVGGTGVGLALCQSIIENHGGVMRLEDTQGGGATFTIELPVASLDQLPEEAAPANEETTYGKLSILLVDDEVELAQTLADLLDPQGHDIDLAANGAIALDKLRKKPFDVIISDLRMPVMDGPTMYAELKKNLPQYLNKIIYVTGDTLSPHVNAFLSETPVPVIEKPYRLADVQKALSKLLKENESQSTLGSGESHLPAPPPETAG
ncbi:MAG: ATP-binding protein [Bdellovibrionales bacterium]|jgi:PAS domain S-box-containing protein